VRAELVRGGTLLVLDGGLHFRREFLRAALARSGNDRTSPQTLMRRGELVFLNELKKRKE